MTSETSAHEPQGGVKVSVVIPVRNEAKYIERCLMSLIEGTYPICDMEIIVVDGQSTDETRNIVMSLSQRFPGVRLLDNPDKVVPNAMNIGIRASRGTYIVRVDAHATYARDYVQRLLDALERLGADNVGGVFVSHPASQAPESRAVAQILSHPFGVGNAIYRLKSDGAPIEVDTVPFGCYRREIFDRIGLFDEIFIRNQDDEFNARLKNAGGKIVLLPDLHIDYVARESIRKMSLMLYQYGYFKPLVAMKLGRPATVRQLVPLLFVLTLIGLPLLSLLIPAAALAWCAAIGLHTAANIYFSARASRVQGFELFAYMVWGFFCAHVSYGFGYLRGIIDFGLLRKHKRRRVQAIPLSR